jgi:murein L,D-transpeptidase YafK
LGTGKAGSIVYPSWLRAASFVASAIINHDANKRSVCISYPNDHDRQKAAEHGSAPGGDIMIHGLPNGFGWLGAAHRAMDWSDGCIAVTDAEIDEIWELVPDGTPIEIRP